MEILLNVLATLAVPIVSFVAWFGISVMRKKGVKMDAELALVQQQFLDVATNQIAKAVPGLMVKAQKELGVSAGAEKYKMVASAIGGIVDGQLKPKQIEGLLNSFIEGNLEDIKGK